MIAFGRIGQPKFDESSQAGTVPHGARTSKKKI